MAKFCTNCGEKLVEGARACGNCGTFINGVENNDTIDNTHINYNNENNGQVKKNTDVGVIGFVLSLISTLCCCGVFNVISLALCIVGLIECNNKPENNKGLAIAGIIISGLGLFSSFLIKFLKYYVSIF